jgi:hypothetical protein
VHDRIAADASEPAAGFNVVDEGGVFRKIAAGHNQRRGEILNQKQMKRRSGQHEA